MKSMNYLKVSVFILFMISVSQPAGSMNKPKLVLLPLLGTGLSDTETMAYQAALESALADRYTVYSGNQVLDALKQQAETICTADYCMEQIAIGFQCNTVARGMIESKTKGNYILVVKFTKVDIDPHQSVFSASQGCSSCSVDDVIKKLKSMLPHARTNDLFFAPEPIPDQTKLYNKEIIRITPEVKGDIRSSKAMVIIESQPDQADVYMGDTLSGQTPYQMKKLEAGQTIIVTLKKKDYYPMQLEATLKGGLNDFKTIHLKPKFGTLIIQSDPSGADLYIAGKHVGTTPYMNERFSSGAVFVTLRKELYKPVENQKVIIRDEQTTQKTFSLKADFGVLKVESDPDDADVKLYDIKGNLAITDKSPCTIKIRAGQYILNLSHSNYETIEFQVPIANNSTEIITRQRATLRKKVGQISVSSTPFKRGADIYINNIKMGTVPQTIELPLGPHTVMVKYNQLTGSEKIQVKDKDSLNVIVTLQDGAGKTFINSLKMTFVYIKPGSFMMGSPSDESNRDSDETRHKVILTKGYYLQTTEITQGQWTAIMGNNPSHFSKCGKDCPVEKISWDDVQEFINKLNRKEHTSRYRLPTEAEWEYAARAGSEKAFANGGITEKECGLDSNLNRMGWYCGNSCVNYNGAYYCSRCINSCKAGTHPVAKKLSNAWGLYDMHGNVWEWCEDRYADYSGSTETDPTGPSSGGLRVLRGGSWDNYARYCRSANRIRYEPGLRIYNLGARLAAFQVQQGE
ncbi:MAG: SUMF1/EgtB/PvdO family nonheme iron enzyme [Candidatus Magnetomorum sp.]|nr:SUMF1/EgtB/PvdO family nonheme iron enzyme [Candidatus Magnetomorum sp.]